MYLYEANKDEIKVYGFSAKRFGRDVKIYKEKQFRNVDPEKRVLRAETNMDFFPLNVDNIRDKMFLWKLNYKDEGLFKTNFHRVIACDFNCFEVYNGTENFYNSAIQSYNLVEVINDESVEYWLVPKEYYQIVHDTYVLKGIINIPEKLRDLYYFETGQFEKLSNNRLKEFRNLYQFRTTPIQTFDRNSIREMIMYGMIENKITDDILERDAETIQRLRKMYK